MDELRDIKPLVSLSWGLPWWLWAVGAALACAVAGALWWRRLRRRAVTPPPSATELALRAIDAVRAADPRDTAEAYALQAHLAVVLRRWLEGRFSVAALEMTTEELASLPRLTEVLGENARETLLTLLKRSDDVRFGECRLEREVHRAAIENARALIGGHA